MVLKTIFLLLITVAMAVIPAFTMLAYFQSIFPCVSKITTLPFLVIYLIQAAFVLIIGFSAMMIYADFMFPLVMHIFGYIFTKAGLSSSSSSSSKEDKLKKSFKNRKIRSQ